MSHTAAATCLHHPATLNTMPWRNPYHYILNPYVPGVAQFDKHVEWLVLSDVDPAWACSLREPQVAAYRQARQKVVESKLEYFQCAPAHAGGPSAGTAWSSCRLLKLFCLKVCCKSI